MDHYKLGDLRDVLQAPIDLFLCSASFELRCRSIADELDCSRVVHAAVARNENLNPYLNGNPDALANKFQGRVSQLRFDTDNPLKAADELWKLFSSLFCGNAKNVLIDVSTFTHEALLVTLRAVQLQARPFDAVRFAYVPAQEYSIGDSDADKWLSKGIREIRSVLGYPGEILPSRKIHLIVLVGFETERARALVEAYEPSLLTLGYSAEESSTSKRNFMANELFHRKIASLFPASKSFMFSADSFAETASALDSVVAAESGYNIVIAPLNTKLSTIGSALAAFANQSIQLCYAQAELYNVEHYSTPGDSVHLFSIPGLGAA